MKRQWGTPTVSYDLHLVSNVLVDRPDREDLLSTLLDGEVPEDVSETVLRDAEAAAENARQLIEATLESKGIGQEGEVSLDMDGPVLSVCITYNTGAMNNPGPVLKSVSAALRDAAAKFDLVMYDPQSDTWGPDLDSSTISGGFRRGQEVVRSVTRETAVPQPRSPWWKFWGR